MVIPMICFAMPWPANRPVGGLVVLCTGRFAMILRSDGHFVIVITRGLPRLMCRGRVAGEISCEERQFVVRVHPTMMSPVYCGRYSNLARATASLWHHRLRAGTEE